jgi:glycosyltransferase involved in cell wall biosynthesis
MNGKSTSISVALTTCNGCPYLGPQLESMADQTRRPDEIVIGDDRSEDDTVRVIEEFASERGIPTHWQRNHTRVGTLRNVEQVVARCRGDIVVFADQDDVWMPQKLARIEEVLTADPGATYVFSDGLFIDERGAPLPGTLFGRVPFDATERAVFRDGGALEVLIKHNVVTGATLAVRRAALQRLVPLDPGWVHDYYLALGLSALGRGILLDEPLIHYRRHSRQQIGFASRGWKGVVALARLQNAAHSRQGAEAFERLRTRLVALGVDPKQPFLDDLSRKARFLMRRAEMCARPSRAPLVMWRAFRDGGYRRYALGWKQAVLDLVALGVGPGPSLE